MPDSNPLILKLRQSGLLAEEDHHRLADVCREPQIVEADTILLRQGEQPRGVHLVLSGFACRYRITPGGKRQILSLLLPGDFCDIQGAVLGQSDHFTATLTDSAIAWLSKETIDDLTFDRSGIARALWWATLLDECILRSWLANMGQQPADKWFAHLCCETLLRLQAVGFADATSCDMPLSQEQLGDILGISNVHVSRVLKELRDQGLLEMKHRRLVIKDMSKLQAFCEFDPSYLHLNTGRDAQGRGLTEPAACSVVAPES